MKTIFLIITITSTIIFAASPRISIYPLPIVSFAPETSWRAGITTRFIIDTYRDSLTRKSNAKLSLSYTGLEQIILEARWNYFLKGEKWFTRGRTDYSKFREFYYGIGETEAQSEIDFDFRRTDIRIGLFYKLKESLFTGPIYRFLEYDRIERNFDEELYPELTASHVNSFGWSLIYDNRKNLLSPLTGEFGELALFQNFNDGDVESRSYQKTIIDLRKYYTLDSNYTLALRSYNVHNIGDAPFYDLALIGGEEVARGYLLGRHRSNNMMTIQSDIRITLPGITFDYPIIGKYESIFGVGIFGGISRVFRKISDFTKATLFPNYGVSFKWMIDKSERVNIRFDYGVGIDGESGFYIKFGESF